MFYYTLGFRKKPSIASSECLFVFCFVFVFVLMLVLVLVLVLVRVRVCACICDCADVTLGSLIAIRNVILKLIAKLLR